MIKEEHALLFFFLISVARCCIIIFMKPKTTILHPQASMTNYNLFVYIPILGRFANTSFTQSVQYNNDSIEFILTTVRETLNYGVVAETMKQTTQTSTTTNTSSVFFNDIFK